MSGLWDIFTEPYQALLMFVGGTETCLFRDREVKVSSWARDPIP